MPFQFVYDHLAAATKIALGNEVGPQLEHVFLVENFGSVDLHDIAFQLEIPVLTDEGDILLYVTDKARLLDLGASGECLNSWGPYLLWQESKAGSVLE